ncbi:hypothetical protein [Methanocaldococcus sp.]
MMNSIDLTLGTFILLIGLAYWTTTMVDYNNNYVDMVKQDYKFSLAINTMESLIKSGTLEDAVILYYANKTDSCIELLNQSIPLSNYSLYIDNNLIISKGLNLNSSIYVVSTLTINRSVGWYVLYGNNKDDLKISDERFLSYEEAYNRYSNFAIDMPIYLSKPINSVKVKLVIQ